MRTVFVLTILLSTAASAQEVTATAAPGSPSRVEYGSATFGGSGLESVRSATIVPDTISVSTHFGFFSQDDLLGTNEHDEYRAFIVAAAFAPLDWLELSAAARSATLDQFSSAGAERTPLENDLFFRLKLATKLGDWVALGADATARIPPPPSPGTTGFSYASGQFTGLATFDLSGLGVPVRAHLNAGYLLDNTKSLGITDQARSLALGLSPYDQFIEGAGLEARTQMSDVWIIPFVEQSWSIPVNAGNDASAFPLVLTPGLRVLPWRGLYLDAAVSFGLTPHQILGVAPVPTVMGVFSVGYQMDYARGDRVVVRVVEKPVEKAPSTGTVRGVVRDAVTLRPLPDVVVTLPGRNRLLADAVGTFTAADVDPGPITVKAEARGFKSVVASGEVKPGQVLAVDLEMAALPPPPPAPMLLKGTVLSDDGKPLEATVSVPGAKVSTVTSDGEYTLGVPPGENVIDVSSKGYLQQGKRLVGDPGETVMLDFVLKPVAKTQLVILKKDKIEIKKQVHFAVNRDIILPDSDQLLDEVAATILSNADVIPLVRVEGHTDSQGEDAYNMDLSTRRAEAVVRALEERGVPKQRLSAQGFGRTRPIAPNSTEKGRARNRRVEFIIGTQG